MVVEAELPFDRAGTHLCLEFCYIIWSPAMIHSSIDVPVMVNSSLEEYLKSNRSLHDEYPAGTHTFVLAKTAPKL
jgi:hypothetical protein